jgi:nitrate/nitrite-specific signal transduction histidine kinase
VPATLLDFLRLSHRWVGPIYRLRTSLQALNPGEAVKPLAFRDGDFWQELAGDFNQMADELKRLRASEAPPENA